jgi:hypothetical protein
MQWDMDFRTDEVIGYFQSTYSFQQHHGPGVYSVSNKNEYLKSSWKVKRGWHERLTTSMPSVGVSISHNPIGLRGLLQG